MSRTCEDCAVTTVGAITVLHLLDLRILYFEFGFIQHRPIAALRLLSDLIAFDRESRSHYLDTPTKDHSSYSPFFLPAF